MNSIPGVVAIPAAPGASPGLIMISTGDTADRRNPAPVNSWFIPLLKGFLRSQGAGSLPSTVSQLVKVSFYLQFEFPFFSVSINNLCWLPSIIFCQGPWGQFVLKSLVFTPQMLGNSGRWVTRKDLKQLRYGFPKWYISHWESKQKNTFNKAMNDPIHSCFCIFNWNNQDDNPHTLELHPNWLVVSTILKNTKVSWDDYLITLHILREKNMFQTTNQDIYWIIG